MPRPAARSLALLLGRTAIAAVLPVMAAAQDFSIDPAAVDLGEISFTVLGADPVGDQADPFTLTGVKTATPITEVPQSVSVVSAEEIADTNAAKVDEALQFTAGVQAQPFGYDSDTNWVYSRGFDATQTGQFLDGLQLYSYAFGAFVIDPFLVERIEVLRGPSSVLYGSSNPGGVINYASRLPGGEPGTFLELGLDTEDRAWASVDTGGMMGETAYRLGVKAQQVGGHGTFEDGFEGVLSAGVAREIGPGTLTTTLSYTHFDEDHVGGGFLPYEGTVEEAAFGRFDQYFNAGEPDVDSYEREQTIATAIWQQELGGWRLTDTARYAYADVAEDYVYAFGYAVAPTPAAPDGELTRFVFAHDTSVSLLANDLRAERTLTFGGAEHRLLVGLDARRFWLDQVQAFAVGTPLSVTDPDYGAAQPEAAPYIDQELTQTAVGVYAQDQIRWGDGWIATLNARFDAVNTDFGPNEAPFGGPGVERDDSELSYRVGLAREIGNFVPYVTAGTYFNPQVVSTPDSETLDPETGRQVEVGVKFSPDNRTLLTVAAFHNTRENIAQTRVDGGVTEFVQFPEVTSTGIEAEAQGEIRPGLTYFGSATLLDVEITEDTDEALVGNTPFVVAEELASFSLSWAPAATEGLTLTGGFRYVGDTWADNANTLEVPSFLLTDAGVRYDFAGGWSANLDVSNLTDEEYVASCQSASACFQGEGRVLSLALRRSF